MQNGKVSALQDALESHGYPANILFCFDNGYTEIAETLHGFYSSAQQLLFAACTTAGAALFVFLALFVNRQRRTLGLMLSLGSGKRSAVVFNWKVAALPIALATIIGIITGVLAMNATTRSLFSSVSEVLNTGLSGAATIGYNDMITKIVSMPIAVIIAGILQLLVYIVAIYLHLRKLAQQPPLKLMQKS